MRRLVLIAILAVLAGGAVAALGAAVTHTRTASSGSTVATLSWTANHSTTGLPYSNLRLDIRRGGSDLFDDPVHGLLCGTGCWPALGVRSAPVAVSDIEGDGAPDVIVGLYSGGAHCCYVTQIYRYDPGTQTYAVAQRDRVTRAHHDGRDDATEQRGAGAQRYRDGGRREHADRRGRSGRHDRSARG